MSDISRQAYADMFGPTTGDKVRLADTDLWSEVEKDFTTATAWARGKCAPMHVWIW